MHMHDRLSKKYTCFNDYSRLITLTYRQCLRKTPERRTVYTAIRSRGPETSRLSWRLTQRQASSTSCGRDSLLYSCCLRTPVQVRSWFQHTAVRKSIHAALIAIVVIPCVICTSRFYSQIPVLHPNGKIIYMYVLTIFFHKNSKMNCSSKI